MRWVLLCVGLVLGWVAEAQSMPSRNCPLYLYRDRVFVGSGVRAVVKEKDQTLAVVKNNSYAVRELSPGEHVLSTGPRSRKVSCVNGEAVYLRLVPVSGLFFSRFLLSVDPVDGPAAIATLPKASGLPPKK